MGAARAVTVELFHAVSEIDVLPAQPGLGEDNGGKGGTKPLAFIGKGVCFDTGGISIKPANGMEEMKWDMGGAGVVIGLMKALAGRKAQVNAVGICGCSCICPWRNSLTSRAYCLVLLGRFNFLMRLAFRQRHHNQAFRQSGYGKPCRVYLFIHTIFSAVMLNYCVLCNSHMTDQPGSCRESLA